MTHSNQAIYDQGFEAGRKAGYKTGWHALGDQLAVVVVVEDEEVSVYSNLPSAGVYFVDLDRGAKGFYCPWCEETTGRWSWAEAHPKCFSDFEKTRAESRARLKGAPDDTQ
jgi:hypothetical protein